MGNATYPRISTPTAIHGLTSHSFKLGGCSVFIFYTFWTPPGTRLPLVYTFLDEIRKLINPQFILLQYDFPILPVLHLIKTSSVYIIYTRGTLKRLILPCIACDWKEVISDRLLDQRQTLNIPGGPTSLDDIRTRWLQNNLDLRKNPVQMELDDIYTNSISSADVKSCWLRNNEYLEDLKADNCVKFVLAQYYNFTLSAPTDGYETGVYSIVVSDLPSISFYNEILRKHSSDLAWSVHGAKLESFYFAVVTDPTEMGLNAVFMPFDKTTWSLIANFLLIFTLLLGLSSSSRNSKFFSAFRKYLLWTSSAILEQSNPFPLKNLGTKMPLFFIFWLIMSLFCGVFYKGALYSYLTAQPVPTVPQTLEEVVQENLAIVTSTKMKSKAHPDDIFYPLANILKDLLGGEVNQTRKQSDAFAYRLQTIYERVEGLMSEEAELARNVSLKLKVAVHPNTSVALPGRFVLVDGIEDLTAFIEGMKYYSKSFVIKSSEVTPFVMRVPWLVARNFFYDLFSRGLGALVESGLYQRWIRLSHIGAQLRDLDKFEGDLDNEDDVNHYARLLLATNYHKKYLSEAQHVSLNLMKMPFAFCAIFGLVPIVVLILELIFKNRVELLISFETLKQKGFSRQTKVVSFVEGLENGMFPWVA